MLVFEERGRPKNLEKQFRLPSPGNNRRIFDSLKVCAFSCRVHTEPPQLYENLDAYSDFLMTLK